MKKEDAEEYTAALGQVVSGGWRQIALGKRLGVPKALGLTVDEWVQKRLGGYVQMSIAERRSAAAELSAEGLSPEDIGDVVGVSSKTIRRDLDAGTNVQAVEENANKKEDLFADTGTNVPEPLDAMGALAITEDQQAAVAKKQRKADSDREKSETRRLAASEAKQELGAADHGVAHDSFVAVAESIQPDSVPLIFTDPPYHDKTIGLYADLGVVAARTLRDGGSLITYTSHHRMPEVITMLQNAGLTFFWPLAMVHSGPKARMTEYGIVVHWKPLLWFVKGRFRDRLDMKLVNDLVQSVPEKTAHPWQQGTVEARYYIEALTQPGDLVFDPFCGGGTTAVACAQTGRRWLTCDVDEEAVMIARKRIADEQDVEVI